MKNFLLYFMKILVLVYVVMFHANVSAKANIYPDTLGNGDLIIVTGHMGAATYAVKSSVAVEEYNPPYYKISIDIITYSFSEDYYRKTGTYVGGPYKLHLKQRMTFFYNYESKDVHYYDEKRNTWKYWDIRVNHSNAEGWPLIPNTAEVAFVSAYNMRFFGDEKYYSPILKQHLQIINGRIYDLLGV